MRTHLMAVLSLVACSACIGDLFSPFQGGVVVSERPDAGSSVDMGSKCAAAAGIPGENLLCVDFKSESLDSLTKDKNWYFKEKCWAIDTKFGLKIADWDGLQGSSCDFDLPTLNSETNRPYKRLKLFIIHTADLKKDIMGVKVKQSAQIVLTSNAAVIIYHATANQPLKQAMNIDIDVPNDSDVDMGNGFSSFQIKFQLSVEEMTMPDGTRGWLIDSIAVNGEY